MALHDLKLTNHIILISPGLSWHKLF